MSTFDTKKIGKVTETGIHGFFGEYSFLSNFYKAPLEYEGMLYPSSENAYQAAKSLDRETRLKFLNIAPNKSKYLGRSIQIRPDWETVKKEVMLEIVRCKFQQNKNLADLLLATGEKYLEETNWWNDTYWGVCNNKGHNVLGHILMQVREELKKGRL